MSDQGRMILATAAGALAGAVVGYLYLTEGGRRVREQIEPKLDDALHEIGRLRTTITKAQSVAAEGWRSLHQIAGSEGRGRDWAQPRQTTAF